MGRRLEPIKGLAGTSATVFPQIPMLDAITCIIHAYHCATAAPPSSRAHGKKSVHTCTSEYALGVLREAADSGMTLWSCGVGGEESSEAMCHGEGQCDLSPGPFCMMLTPPST